MMPAASSASFPPAPSTIILNVGGRQFRTTPQLLQEKCPYFAAHFAAHGVSSGSYFLPLQGDVFEDVLTYLEGGIYPLFWDKAMGFNHARYLLVLEQARFLRLSELAAWIEQQGYLAAVKTITTVKKRELKEPGADFLRTSDDGDTEVTTHVEWHTERVYRCPRGIAVHHGNRGACGKQCRAARGEGEDDLFDEKKTAVVVTVKKRTLFNPAACIPK